MRTNVRSVSTTNFCSKGAGVSRGIEFCRVLTLPMPLRRVRMGQDTLTQEHVGRRPLAQKTQFPDPAEFTSLKEAAATMSRAPLDSRHLFSSKPLADPEPGFSELRGGRSPPTPHSTQNYVT